MSLRHSPTIDELLGDSLVQAVMRADKVEPLALRTLLADAAYRLADARVEQRPASGLLAAKKPNSWATIAGAKSVSRKRPIAIFRPGAEREEQTASLI